LADELRPAWANALPSDQVLVQALLVEVERRPIVAMEDTTLRELQGIAVWVSHRAWATTRKEALEIARRLVAWSGGRMVKWSGGETKDRRPRTNIPSDQ